MKSIYIDCETTGLLPETHGLCQIAGIVVIDGAETEEFNFHVQPIKGKMVSAEALKKNRMTTDMLRGFPDPQKVFDDLIALFDKYVEKYNKFDKFNFIAYNSPFDSGFVRAFLTELGDKYTYGCYFHAPDLCIMRYAGMKLRADRSELINFKLETVAKFLGIEIIESEMHDALTDIRVTMEIERRLEGENVR